MKELVSIVMPSYNTGAYIQKSIDSVLSQTYENWELIIVDDCSTDSTEIFVGKYLYDRRIKFVKTNHNSGAAVCRNIALREAKGRWIAFLDSDDIWFPDKLAHQISFMERNGYSFSYTEYSEIDADGNALNRIVSGPAKLTLRSFYRYCWPGCLTVMYDCKTIGLIQIREIRKNNDYAMWLKVAKRADCFLLKEELAHYRRGRKNSISTVGVFKMIKWHYVLFREAEGMGAVCSLFCTIRNLLFGVIKKILFVKKVV